MYATEPHPGWATNNITHNISPELSRSKKTTRQHYLPYFHCGFPVAHQLGHIAAQWIVILRVLPILLILNERK